MPTQTVYVVDEDGATFTFLDRADAERTLVREAWRGAVHLTITEAEAPVGLKGVALLDWCIGNVPPITCEAQ